MKITKAQEIKLETKLENEFDCIIIGGGPAGLTSAIYALRAGLKTMLIEKYATGGQAALTASIENYPGFISIDGFELMSKMLEQSQLLGLEIVYADVLNLNLSQKLKTIKTTEGTFLSKSIILSMGASAKKLGLDNEEELLGKGLSYCAICDGAFFKNKTCVVVGGGNSAIEDALYLSKFAKKVYLIHRRDSFKADDILTKELAHMCSVKNECAQIIFNSYITSIIAENDTVTAVKIKDVHSGKESVLDTQGVFVAIGRSPQSEIVSGQVDINSNGYIIVNNEMATNIPGVFAAGDITNKSLKQIITACSDGAIAADSANKYLKSF